MKSKVLSVMFTDIEGFTARTAQQSRDELSSLLDKHSKLLKPYFGRFGGKLVKTIGDAFLVTFESPTNAVLCGLAIQDALQKWNSKRSKEEQIMVRVAISSGEVVIKEKDVFGEAVNTASRLEGITNAGEIYFTESVYLAMNKKEVPTSEIGVRRFKGISEPIKIYRVLQDENLNLYNKVIERVRKVKVSEEEKIPPYSRKKWLFPFLTFILIGITIGVILLLSGDDRLETANRLTADGNFDEAMALAEAFERDNPGKGIASLKKSALGKLEALKNQNRFDEAIKFVEEMASSKQYFQFLREENEGIEVKKSEALSAKAVLLASNGNFDEALLLAEEAKETRPDIGLSTVKKIVTIRLEELKDKGRLDAAIQFIDDMIKSKPYLGFLHSERVAIELSRARTLQEMKNLLGRYPENPTVLFETAKAILAYNSPNVAFGSWPEVAFKYYKRAFEIKSSLAQEAVVKEHLLKGFRLASPVQDGPEDDYMRAIAADFRYDEIRDTLLKGLADESWYFRVNCFLTIKEKESLENIDLWYYHSANLIQGIRYGYAEAAIDYFIGEVPPGRSDDALRILEEAANSPAIEPSSRFGANPLYDKLQAALERMRANR